MTLRLHLRRPPGATKQRKHSTHTRAVYSRAKSRAQVWEGHDLGRAVESLEMCLRFQRLRYAFRTFSDVLHRLLQPCCKRRKTNMASDRWPLLRAFTWLPRTSQTWRDDHASQIVEFAVSLPLLLVFVVGIFDFSGAFTLKQKLTDAARDAARTAAADPANDLSGFFSGTAPLSVIDAFQIVDKFLKANNINDCGIASATPTSTALTWTYANSTGCPGAGLSITINRGYYFPSTSTAPASTNCSISQPPGGQTAVLSTCVNISYAYSWRFDRVITLLGSRASVPTSITATAVAMNEN